jgi:hypothetical protein
VTTGTATVRFRGREYTLTGRDFMRWVRLVAADPRNAPRRMAVGDVRPWSFLHDDEDGTEIETVVAAESASAAVTWWVEEGMPSAVSPEEIPWDVEVIGDEKLERPDRSVDLVDAALHAIEHGAEWPAVIATFRQ